MLPSNLIDDDNDNLINPNINEKRNFLIEYVNNKLNQLDNMSDIDLLCEDIKLKQIIDEKIKNKNKHCIKCIVNKIQPSANIIRADTIFKNSDDMEEFRRMFQESRNFNNKCITSFLSFFDKKILYDASLGYYYKYNDITISHLEDHINRFWVDTSKEYKVEFINSRKLTIYFKYGVKVIAEGYNVKITIDNVIFDIDIQEDNLFEKRDYVIIIENGLLIFKYFEEILFSYRFVFDNGRYDQDFNIYNGCSKHKAFNKKFIQIKSLNKNKKFLYNIHLDKHIKDKIEIEIFSDYENTQQKYKHIIRENNTEKIKYIYKKNTTENKLLFVFCIVNDYIIFNNNRRKIVYKNVKDMYEPVNKEFISHGKFGKNFQYNLLCNVDKYYEEFFRCIK